MRLKGLLLWGLLFCSSFIYASEEALQFIKGDENIVPEYQYLGKEFDSTELLQLQAKLSVNTSENNHKAVLRDKLVLDFHSISTREKEFLNTLKELWKVHGSKKMIDSYIQKDILFLSEYKKSLDLEKIAEFKLDDKFGNIITQNYTQLNIFLTKYHDLLVFLKENLSAQEYSIEALDDLFSYTYNWVYKVNDYSKNQGLYYELGPLNTGNIVVSLASLAIIGIILRLGIFHLLKLILRISMRTNGVRLEKLVHSVDRPLLFFILLISIWLSIKVVSYPENFSLLNEIFAFSSLFLIFWFIWRLLTNYQEIIINGIGSINKDKGVQYGEDIAIFSIKIAKAVAVLFFFFLVFFVFYEEAFLKMLAGAGAAGLILGWFMQDSVKGYFATAKLVFNSNLKSGDWIECSANKVSADLYRIGLYYSELRGFDNSVIHVPNIELVKMTFINWSQRKVGRKVNISNIRFPLNSSPELIEGFITNVREYLLSNDDIAKDLNVSAKKSLEWGYKDTLMVHLIDYSKTAALVNIYCFSHSIGWEDNRRVTQEVLLEVKKIATDIGLEFAPEYQMQLLD